MVAAAVDSTKAILRLHYQVWTQHLRQRPQRLLALQALRVPVQAPYLPGMYLPPRLMEGG
jgi:hypothetical protein